MTLVKIPTGIKVNGAYANISQFFDEIESLPRALMVPGFTLQRYKDGKYLPAEWVGKNPLTVEIDALVYMTTKQAAAPVTPVAPPVDVTK
jgi:Tfp pilus assembly protein PilO